APVGAPLFGTPLAFCLARVDVPGKTVLLTLATMPLVLPSFVAAYALVLLFGHAGVVTTGLRSIGIPIGPIYGLTGITIVFLLTLYPYVLMPAIAGFRAIDISIEEAARNLGGSRLHAFRTVLLPVAMPAVLAGACSPRASVGASWYCRCCRSWPSCSSRSSIFAARCSRGSSG